jgi:effector-binding domain-containing protein
MLSLPQNQTRPAQAYIYVPFTVTMRQMQRPADEGFPILFAYIEEHGLTPVGPAFYNYRRIDMAGTLDVEAGIAVEALGLGEAGVHSGTLPAGNYASVTWHGHPDGLIGATSQLIDWVKNEGQSFDMEEKSDGDHFACRLELYHSDPLEDPDMDNWTTELAFKLRD